MTNDERTGTMTTITYEEACAAAATDQGLDPIVAVLKDAGLPVTLDQTGGFCMCVRVQGEDWRRYVWITHSETCFCVGEFCDCATAATYYDGHNGTEYASCAECGEQCYGHDVVDVVLADLPTTVREALR